MGKVVERIVNAERVEDLITVFGSFDENIKRIEEALNVRVVNRGTDLRVSGDEEMADKAVRTLEGLLSLAAKGETIDEQRVRYLITLVNEGNDAQVAQMAKDVVCITAKGKPIKAKTVGQQNYMKAIMKNTITIGVGPAGTGKTYLAVAAAVAAFRERTEHHPRADENVPDPSWLRLENRHHWRRDPDRSARRQGFRPEGRRAGAGRGEGHCHLPPDRRGRGAPRPGAGDHQRLRALGSEKGSQNPDPSDSGPLPSEEELT